MKYIFIGSLLGSIVTSSHDNEEACKGREVMLKDKGVIGQCVKENQNLAYSNSNVAVCYSLNGIYTCNNK